MCTVTRVFLCCPFKLKSRRLMSSLQSLETLRGIRSCCSQVNGAALQKQRAAVCLSRAGALPLFALLRVSPQEGTEDCLALEIKRPC